MAIDASDVKDILDTDLADATIETFISQAGELVSDETVQTWLSAHLIAVSRDRTADKESVGDHSITFSGETGLGLDSTHFGQMAQQFDTDGELKNAKTADVNISSWD